MMQNPILFPKRSTLKYVSDDTDVALVLRYVGSEASATVTVAAGGDITLKHGDAGSEAGDTTISSSGVIDVSDTSYDTFGEVLDTINGSANWEAYLVGALRADSSNDTLLARSETTITPFQELSLYKDTSAALNLGVRIGGREHVTGSEEKFAAEIYEITSTNTFGSGSNTIKVYEMDEINKTETLIYSKAGGATTVEDEKSFVTNARGSMATSKQGKYLLVKMIGSAACTGNLQVIGAVASGG